MRRGLCVFFITDLLGGVVERGAVGGRGVDQRDGADRASDRVLAEVVGDVQALPADADPIDNMRAIALAVFDVVVTRPWLASYFMR